MTHALTLTAATADTLFAAHLLCEVCEDRPWTQRATWHATLVCASCAEGEPAVETAHPATALALWEADPDASILSLGTQYAVGYPAALATLGDVWRQTSPEELEALLAQGQ